MSATDLTPGEQLFRIVVESAPTAMVMIDRGGRIVMINAETEKVFGYARQELLGQLVEILLPQRFRPQHPGLRNSFFETPQIRRMGAGRDLYALRKDHTEFPVEIGLQPLELAEGLFVLASIVDITARKETQQHLEDALAERTRDLHEQRLAALNLAQDADEARQRAQISERRLSAVVDSAEVGCWELDLTNDQAWRSLRHDQIFGYEAMLPKWGYDIFIEHVLPADRDRVKAALATALTTGSFEAECQIRWPNGSAHWINAKGRVHRDDEGRPIRMMGLVMDIDARKQMEQTLEKQAAELARSNADLELFASIASHDLQEPLRMVSSYMDLLAGRYQGKLDDKATRWIGFAVDGVGRMKQLIGDLLEFSRVGTRGKKFTPTDCNVAFQQVLQNLQQAVKESGAEVTADALPTVQADGTQIVQVLQNLIGNAIKFHGDRPPVVRVEAQRRQAAWLFSVRDNGIGIDAQFADKVFAIFQRLHTREEYPGSGIGLAVCKKVVERHGGRIWFESLPGQGTTFFFTIPDRKEA